jgi:hypothetical protein
MKPRGSGTLFSVERAKRWGFIDAHGRIVIAPQFDLVRDFFEGLAAIEKGGKSGFIDERGHVAFWLPGNIHPVGSFSEGLAPFQVGDNWGYLDTAGRVAIRPQFYDVNPFCDGLARVWVLAKEKRFDYIDHAGKFVIPPRYWVAYDFSNGLAMVREPR